MSYTQEQKEMFYQNLSSLLRTVPKDSKLVLLGDFNARVGNDSQSWPDVIGLHGVGQEYSNGQLLLTFCAEYGLTITNTLFQLPNIHKVTWMHPRSRHWHLIDYVITRRRDTQDVRITVLSGLMSSEFLQHQVDMFLRPSFTAKITSRSLLEGNPRKSLVSSTQPSVLQRFGTRKVVYV